MQSLIHGNFEGAMQRKAYALVGAAAAIGFLTAFRMMRLPDPEPASAAEMALV
jgi:hypothetical protein